MNAEVIKNNNNNTEENAIETKEIKAMNANTINNNNNNNNTTIQVTGISQEMLQKLLQNAGIDSAKIVAKQQKINDKLKYTDESKTHAVCSADSSHIFNVTELDEETRQAVMKSGLCPECLNILKQAAEIKKVSGFRTRVATDNRPSPNKPGYQIREIIKNNLINVDDETLTKLQDKEFSRTNFKLAYPLLLDVTNKSSEEIKTARMFGKHARYSPAIYTVGNRQFLLTNDLYEKNLQPIANFFAKLVG